MSSAVSGTGIAGAIVVWLTPPDNSGRSVGCASDLDPALLHEILVSPASFIAIGLASSWAGARLVEAMVYGCHGR